MRQKYPELKQYEDFINEFINVYNSRDNVEFNKLIHRTAEKLFKFNAVERVLKYLAEESTVTNNTEINH